MPLEVVLNMKAAVLLHVFLYGLVVILQFGIKLHEIASSSQFLVVSAVCIGALSAVLGSAVLQFSYLTIGSRRRWSTKIKEVTSNNLALAPFSLQVLKLSEL